MISCSDHRLNCVEDWVVAHINTLSDLFGQPLRREDFTDDKLGIALRYLWNKTLRMPCEKDITKHIITVYDLQIDNIRVDATIGQSFVKPIKDWLFQYGNAKHFRSDLPQFKLMMSVADPLGMPLSSMTVSGNKADDPLYIPVIQNTMDIVGSKGKLYVGDCKMGAIDTRYFIDSRESFYLMPLSWVQVLEDDIYTYLDTFKDTQMTNILDDTWEEIIAYWYTFTEEVTHTNSEGKEAKRQEKRFLVCSTAFAKSQEDSLDTRVKKAKEEINKLNEKKQGKKVLKTVEEAETACERIVEKYKVVWLLSYVIMSDTIQKREYKKAKNKKKNEPISVTIYTVSVVINQDQVKKTKAGLGWRIYATNDLDLMSIEKAIATYRDEFIIERRFDHLKNSILQLLPLYLHEEAKIKGLINLSLLCLRVISLIEYKVASELKKHGDTIDHIYAWNPKKKTQTPTIPTIIRAFDGINMVYATEWQNIWLNRTQLKFISLLGIENFYRKPLSPPIVVVI